MATIERSGADPRQLGRQGRAVSGSVGPVETLLLFADAPSARTARWSRLADDAHAQTLTAGFLQDLADTCGRWRAQQLGADLNRRVALYVHQGREHPALADAARRAGARVEVAEGADWATRLRNAFAAEHERGARAVCAIGTHAPSIPAHLLDEAFRALGWERAVLGPAFDGATWLVGAQRPAPDVFSDASWSAPQATVRTVARLRDLGAEPHVLPFWYAATDDDGLARLAWHVASVRARQPDALPATWRALVDAGLVTEPHTP